MDEDLFDEEKDEVASKTEKSEIFDDEEKIDIDEAIEENDDDAEEIDIDKAIEEIDDDAEEIDFDEAIEEEEEAEEIDIDAAIEEIDDDTEEIDINEAIEEEEEEEEEEDDEIDIDAAIKEAEEIDIDAAIEENDNDAWIPLDDDDSEEEDLDIDDLEEDLDIDDESEEEFEDEEDDDEIEAPPWEEEVEIPVQKTERPSKKKKTIILGGIILTVVLAAIAIFTFFDSDGTSDEATKESEEQKPTFVTKKMVDIPSKKALPNNKPLEPEEPVRPVEKKNAVPTIKGKPSKIAHEGVSYIFEPKAEDSDSTDKITFFIANQPVWTNFDTTTGILKGIPRNDDVGTYEKIAILISDGRATASLPIFDITVIGTKKDNINLKKAAIETKHKPKIQPKSKSKKSIKKPLPKKKAKESKADAYTLPVLTDLIKNSKFQDAAIEYHKKTRRIPNAYSLKLEVDCLEESVEVAFKRSKFDRRIFILPKDINGKSCYVVFWGVYSTKREALKAISTIPSYFREESIKPQLTILKQYL